jgi:ribosomal protein S18 acetylase RimI-like enzyme
LRRLRRIFGPARQPDGLSIRKLRAADLPRFFQPVDQPLGLKWLGLQERDLIYVAVAEIDGMAVGRSCLQYNPLSDPPSAYMFGSSVSADWRSRGIGSALIAHNESVACSRGMYHVAAHTSTHNTGAAAWRERMGYRRVREEKVEWDEPDGRHLESVCWRYERTLTPSISQKLMNSVMVRLSKLRARIVRHKSS